MAKPRLWFFDTFNPDRLNTGDVPTQQTFERLLDSIPFYVESNSSAAFRKAGIAKTTNDKKVNLRQGGDTGQDGFSPSGFITFVQPQQLPRVTGGTDISVTEVIRSPSGDEELDTGGAIKDYQINWTGTFPPIPDNTTLIELGTNMQLQTITGTPPPYSLGGIVYDAQTQLSTLLLNLLEQHSEALRRIKELGDIGNLDTIPVGDIVLSVTPPNGWNTVGSSVEYDEPRGQALSKTDYATLYGLIGDRYGSTATTFNLPNLNGSRYLRAVESNSSVIGFTDGDADYTLTETNIPQHNHSFTATTETAGAHTHTYVNEGNTGTGSNTDTTSSAGNHTHNVNGTTNNYGDSSPTPVPIDRQHINFYLKMRLK